MNGEPLATAIANQAETSGSPCTGDVRAMYGQENGNPKELTYEEFCAQPLTYTLGMSGDWGARRMHRNDELGIQRETYTKRKRHGDIYGGWKESEVAYFLDGDERQFANAAELYVAWMHRVCGVEEQKYE